MVDRPAVKTPSRKFVLLRWHYAPTGKPEKECFPFAEDARATLDEAIADAVSGEVEDVVQAIEIDLDAGTARDVTNDVLWAVEESEERRAEEAERRGFDPQREWGTLSNSMQGTGR